MTSIHFSAANNSPFRYEYQVTQEEQGIRLDVFLAKQNLPFSRSQMSRRIEEGEVQVQGKPAKPGQKLKADQHVVFVPPPVRTTSDQPENIPLDILYEDTYLIVVNKPAGMIVHPSAGHESGTLVNALLYHCGSLPFPTYPSGLIPQVSSAQESGKQTTDINHDMDEELISAPLAIGGEHRPGIVHRLDQGTSGVLVCAKEERTLRALQTQFQSHSIKRTYYALVEGVTPQQGSFRTKYGRHPHDPKRFTAHFGSKQAVTHYQVLERLKGLTLVRVELETGRTHQIRVHFSEAGHPLLGDTLYGGKKKNRSPLLQQLHESLGHQALHARELGFIHPHTQEFLAFSKELPQDFEQTLSTLRNSGKDIFS